MTFANFDSKKKKENTKYIFQIFSRARRNFKNLTFLTFIFHFQNMTKVGFFKISLEHV